MIGDAHGLRQKRIVVPEVTNIVGCAAATCDVVRGRLRWRFGVLRRRDAQPRSGPGLNPARALGPMLIAGEFDDWWIYLVAPVAGGTLGAWAGARLICDLDCVT